MYTTIGFLGEGGSRCVGFDADTSDEIEVVNVVDILAYGPEFECQWTDDVFFVPLRGYGILYIYNCIFDFLIVFCDYSKLAGYEQVD